MGIIICPIHGRQMIVEICHHLHQDFLQQNSNNPRGVNEVRIRYDDIDPELNDPADHTVHYFCNDCIKKYQLPTDKPIQSIERIEQYHNAFHKKMSIVCVKCFKEYHLTVGNSL